MFSNPRKHRYLWVAYGYNETEKVWDEIDFGASFRNLKYLFNPKSRRLKTALAHGFNRFVILRRHSSTLWINCHSFQYITSPRTDVLMRKLLKYERTITHSQRENYKI